MAACSSARVQKQGYVRPLDCRGIELAALALEVRPLVPVEPQPVEVLHEELRVLAALCARVEVLDAHDHAAACGAHGKPGHEARKGIPQVHATRRGWRKATNHSRASGAVRCGSGCIHGYHGRTNGAQECSHNVNSP